MKISLSFLPNWLSVFLLLLFVSEAEAQEKKIFTGKIKTDSLQEISVNIINISRQKGTISKKDGSFEIQVFLEDEILFSALGFENHTIIITDSVLKNQPVEIQLETAVNLLEEVKLSNFNLSGDLVRDAAQIEYFDQTEVGIPFSKHKN